MAIDEALLEAAAEGQGTLRFYRWSEPTLSLGYFQPYADRRQHEPSRQCAVVRRASGGGAILHDIELTYSLAVPAAHPLAADRLGCYQAMHAALVEALADWGVQAVVLQQADKESHNRQPFLCFQRRAPGDVLVDGVKIAGSAQRRCRGAVLQHGSVLLGRSAAAPELPGLADLSGKQVDHRQLLDAWLEKMGTGTSPGTGFAGITHVGSEPVLIFSQPLGRQIGALPADRRSRAAELVDTKYGGAAWTENRGRSGTF
jgi:lipoate-protein ligase A